MAGMGKVLNLKVDIKFLHEKSGVLNPDLGLNSVMSSSKGSNKSVHNNHVPLPGYLASFTVKLFWFWGLIVPAS